MIAINTTMLKNKTTKAMMAGVRERTLRPKMRKPRRHMRGNQEQGSALLRRIYEFGAELGI